MTAPRFILLLALLPTLLAAAPPPPETVAVLYNSDLEESEELARYYASMRGIPRKNLVGLSMPKTSEITREQFEDDIKNPLAREFGSREWWTLGNDPQGRELPVRNKIRVLVTMRGVPLKIKRGDDPAIPTPDPKAKPPAASAAQQMMQKANEAAVDSELCLLGIDGLPIAAPITNRYHRSERPFATADMTYMMLVGRIDAADNDTCRRMIDDARAVEKSGLWGRAYVDIANKFPQGDNWLKGVAKLCNDHGIPTIVDTFNDTLPTNYPMSGAALYFGWYAKHVNGPFRASDFRFRRGAVAVHLHSFSAWNLRDPSRNWCAPLLARGACATIGNVYEPFLGMTHDLEIFLGRLLEGHTLVEAAYMATPGLSWQNVVIGDPLYRPFLHIDGSGEKLAADREFRALRVASMRWGEEPAVLEEQLRKAAKSMNSGTFYEALGLRNLAAGKTTEATELFNLARTAFATSADRLRQDLHLVAIDRAAGRKQEAITRLRDLKTRFGALPEGAAITAWLNILDPPPPPPAKPAAAKPPQGQ